MREPATSVVVAPVWNQFPYDYYRPRLTAAPGVPPGAQWPAGASGDVWLIAERFGPPPPSSPEEAWLDGHLALVDAIRFSRLEVRRYRTGAR